MKRSSVPSLCSRRAQRGQAMTEYIVLVVALFLGLIPVIGALKEAFYRYYDFVAMWISLPVP